MEINFSGFSYDAGVPGCTAGRLLSWVFDRSSGKPGSHYTSFGHKGQETDICRVLMSLRGNYKFHVLEE